MKQSIKNILQSLNLLDAARILFSFLKKFSVENVLKELSVRRKGLPDGYPSPPPALIFLVIRSVWSSDYWNSGVKIVDDLEEHLRRLHLKRDRFERVLDFGCGSGRLTRHLRRFPNASIFGSDYNRTLIDWSSANLPFAQFQLNTLAPPLSYESNFFDLILARSVFTHLDKQLQRDWMNEWKRILRSGGILYFTTHSGSSTHGFNDDFHARLSSEGFVAYNSDLEGDNKCASYQTKEWVERNLTDGFVVLDHIPGRETEHLGQDIYLFQKK